MGIVIHITSCKCTSGAASRHQSRTTDVGRCHQVADFVLINDLCTVAIGRIQSVRRGDPIAKKHWLSATHIYFGEILRIKLRDRSLQDQICTSIEPHPRFLQVMEGYLEVAFQSAYFMVVQASRNYDPHKYIGTKQK
jgi:hypothetical protein